jgi:hypothetical protein
MTTRNDPISKPAGILGYILLLAGLLFTPTAIAAGAASALGAAGFVIYGVGPGENALDAPAGSPVTALFSADLDASAVSSATLRLHGGLSGRLDGSFTFPTGDILRFQPAAGFKPGETVQVSATGGIHSAQGESLRPYTWGFTVAAAQASGAFYAHPSTPSFGGGDSFADARERR